MFDQEVPARLNSSRYIHTPTDKDVLGGPGVTCLQYKAGDRYTDLQTRKEFYVDQEVFSGI